MLHFACVVKFVFVSYRKDLLIKQRCIMYIFVLLKLYSDMLICVFCRKERSQDRAAAL